MSYHTARITGIVALLVVVPAISISTTNGGLRLAKVVVLVVAYHHRLYSALGLSLSVSSGTPIVYPYFSPFTTLARTYQSVVDTLQQEASLVFQTTLTLYIDPHVPSPH